MKVIIETERLILRELSPNDVVSMFNIFSDPITMQFWPKPFDLEGVEKWIQRSLDSYRESGFGRYVANMEVKHVTSKAVAEKIGFKFEREFINSRNRDLQTTLLSFEVSS